jgi:N-acetylneuraminic acid mutarotase
MAGIPPAYASHPFTSLPAPPPPATAIAGPSSNSASSRLSTMSNHTYVLSSASPNKNSRRRTGEPYMPKIITTVGQRPACLVNASVTYVGNDLIYAFGGFDQYTDEVYNHVLKLNLAARQWSLVDNYGDIPGVRMGHTSCLWQGDKLLVYGGENEHRIHLSDVVIFDIKTAHWTQPDINGPIPRGRARHSAVIYDEKLFVCGGMSGNDNGVLDDICFLDLKTWTWSRTWRFVPRYDHSSWVWGGKIWVSGGMGEEMERTNEIWWLDFRGTPAFEGGPTYGMAGSDDGRPLGERYQAYSFAQPQQPIGSTGYAANTSVQSNSATQIQRTPPVAPGAISSVKFISSPNLPIQNVGTHFHVFSSGCMLDFVTPATNMPLETSLSALDLDTLRWQKLADGKDLFSPAYRWHYCCLDADGTHAWLLGCPREVRNGGNGEAEEYLSDVLPIDLRKFGLLGNKMSQEARNEAKLPTSDTYTGSSHLSAIGADLARTFNQPPETGSGTDFTITALRDDDYDMENLSEDGSPSATVNSPPALGLPSSSTSETSSNNTSQPIHVHRLILSARWPHFARLYNAQMSEFHTRRMHIPEPYPAVKAFLYYLYTDSISSPPSEQDTSCGPSLEDVANMLVMSNIYDMPRLRHLCVNRLVRDLDVQHAALIFDRASTAQEDWLKRRAASFCMTHWGRIVRTSAFRNLKRSAMLELCEAIDAEGRVVGGDELEAVGGLGGARLGSGMMGGLWGAGRKRGRIGSTGGTTVDGEVDEDGDVIEGSDEGMDMA